MDIIFIVAIAAFLLICLAFAEGCNSLGEQQ